MRRPFRLCRLRYFGDEDRWGFAFATSSSEHYELSAFPSGEFLAPPEDAFQVSAQLYLQCLAAANDPHAHECLRMSSELTASRPRTASCSTAATQPG